MARVIINDASCLIDLRKGRLLHVLCRLPVEVVVPLPIRESELLDFTPQEWALLDGNGLVTYDVPPDQVGEAFSIKRKNGRLSANDCFCIVTTDHFDDAILLTGDRLLTRVARERALHVHGVLWVTEQLRLLDLCEHGLLRTALTIWRDDKSVFILDLSRFDAAPLIAFIAAKETDYGTETDGRIPPGCGADRADQWANAQAGSG